MKNLNREEQLSRDRIRELRKENNLSLEELGQIAGVSKSTVSRWESGDVRNLKNTVVDTLCDHFHVYKGWLLGLDDPKFESQTPENKLRKEIQRKLMVMKKEDLDKVKLFIDQFIENK